MLYIFLWVALIVVEKETRCEQEFLMAT